MKTGGNDSGSLGRGSTQIRVRLRPEERLIYERVRMAAWQAGQSEAETFSSWVRYSLRSLIGHPVGQEFCQISPELYDKILPLAKRLGMEPKVFIERCIGAIVEMIECPERKPPMVGQCRKLARDDTQGKLLAQASGKPQTWGAGTS